MHAASESTTWGCLDWARPHFQCHVMGEILNIMKAIKRGEREQPSIGVAEAETQFFIRKKTAADVGAISVKVWSVLEDLEWAASELQSTVIPPHTIIMELSFYPASSAGANELSMSLRESDPAPLLLCYDCGYPGREHLCVLAMETSCFLTPPHSLTLPTTLPYSPNHTSTLPTTPLHTSRLPCPPECTFRLLHSPNWASTLPCPASTFPHLHLHAPLFTPSCSLTLPTSPTHASQALNTLHCTHSTP